MPLFGIHKEISKYFILYIDRDVGKLNMRVQRCERIAIKKDHPKYKIIDEMCFKSKELYNYANYIIR